MYLNDHNNLHCMVYTMGLKDNYRFINYEGNSLFKYIKQDVNNEFNIDNKIDYILHLASNTHPMLYATNPISTITTNVIGTKNVLDYATKNKVKRVLFASTVEVYGENRGDIDLFDEDYCGYINCNRLRAGYPESKRCGEALCQAYIEEKKLDVVIARLSRIYGPTVIKSDSKAMSQFIFKALHNEDIVLKSEGKQKYSYTYVADAVYALLLILLKGENAEAYNISYPETDLELRDVAELIANYVSKKVIFELPSETEAKGFSKANLARQNNQKIKGLGFKPKYDLQKGIGETIQIMKEAHYE